ncbi:MAG TPA: hypothetical protein PKM50_01310 [Methanoregula sp.]|nr:hypothetical protein [Methanoregula sp.]
MIREDAVAPVLAAMLVLAVIVTVFAVWNASVAPSMKEQAEVSHLHEVESGILRFSSDIESAASAQNSMTLSERIPLGGGELLFSPARSGGVLAVHDEDEYMWIRLYNASPPSESTLVCNDTFRLPNFSYMPVGNFWQDQGYIWSHGYVNVTKTSLAPTPLEFPTMDNVEYKVTGALFSARSYPNPSDSQNCSVIVIKGVNIIAADSGNSVSGNGIGTLKLNSTQRTEVYSNVSLLNVRLYSTESSDDSFTRFNYALHESVNSSIGTNVLGVCGNIRFDDVDSKSGTIWVKINSTPSVTVIRESTEVVLDAY